MKKDEKLIIRWEERKDKASIKGEGGAEDRRCGVVTVENFPRSSQPPEPKEMCLLSDALKDHSAQMSKTKHFINTQK